MRMPRLFLCVFMVLAAAGARARAETEHVVFDSAGKPTDLICDGATMGIRGEFVVRFERGPTVGLQPHNQRAPITRDGSALRWSGRSEFPNGESAAFEVAWHVDEAGAAAMQGTVRRDGRQWPIEIEALDYEIDVPRDWFVGGAIAGAGRLLPVAREAERWLYAAETDEIILRDAAKNWRLRIGLDRARPVSVADHWDDRGRFYRIRVRLHEGLWTGEQFDLGLTLGLSGRASAPAARVVVDAGERLGRFHGFGGNYCWGNESPVTEYTLKTLRNVWTRHEMKTFLWDRERDNPGPALVEEFERIRR
ncbi:MAG: hypothetical protein D6781_00865, partial [Verrucomicrobia bacterium]